MSLQQEVHLQVVDTSIWIKASAFGAAIGLAKPARPTRFFSLNAVFVPIIFDVHIKIQILDAKIPWNIFCRDHQRTGNQIGVVGNINSRTGKYVNILRGFFKYFRNVCWRAHIASERTVSIGTNHNGGEGREQECERERLKGNEWLGEMDGEKSELMEWMVVCLLIVALP